ncbi:tellurite resistance TerB family protein [Pelagibacterium xiamenense]|uniref:tellurite resistance TerB family protein n=1 Tax=Pelagibacterium xiamenense TaxID=2901140 RepID=UPI001E3A7CF2|nr:tellurite resistance TerB family protein [Pelagibacterium xiamenense]MCD7059061.1 tellurite resistance TerB family protein [Pelagibacterium xiamenense]
MQLSPIDALVYSMVIAAVSDRDITDREIDRFAALISRWPVFESFDIARLPQVATDCVELINKGGLDALLVAISDALEPRLQETAYALAVEITTVDLTLNQEELRLLEMIRDAFSIDRLTTAAIETSARIRHRRL